MPNPFTSEVFTYPGGGVAANVPVAVQFAGTDVLVPIYHEALGAVRKANPTRTNDVGRVTFYAAPGDYELVANGITTNITVTGAVDPPGDDDFITKAQADALYEPLGGGGGGLTNPMTVDLNMGTHKITNVVAGVSGTDAVNKTQMESADTALIAAHNAASDPHGDRAFTTSSITTHSGASDPHGDRAFTTSAIGTHAAASDPHGDRAFTTAAITTHSGAADPHGDRSWASGQFLPLAGGTVSGNLTVNGVAALGNKNSLTNINLCGFKSTPGSPTSGTWAVGDVVIDSTGALFVCTTAGTPGAWAGSNDLTTVLNQNTSAFQYFLLPTVGTTTTIAPADGSAYFTPLVLQKSATLTDVQIEVTTLDAAGNVRCGLASSNADGYPGTWINDLGNFAAITTTGVKSLAAAPSVALAAGVRYWIAVAPQGGTTVVQLRGRSGWNPTLPPVLVNTTPGSGSGAYNASRTHFRATGITGAMSGAITLADLISSGPTVGVKVV